VGDGRGADTTSLRPMLAVAGSPPSGEDWAAEFKWDGVRALVHVGPDGVRIVSRNGNDVTGGYPEFAHLGDGRSMLLDGEIVAFDPHGRPDFGLLQQRMHVRAPGQRLLDAVPVSLYLFDVLSLDGEDLLDLPWNSRRARLEALGADAWSRVAVSPSFTGTPPARVLEVAREHGLEGIVAKRRSSRYEPGRRSSAWVKTALLTTQEVVIGGWTPGKGRRGTTLGSLLLGARDAGGNLRYLGHVGTGFTEAMLRSLLERLTPMQRRTSPFDEEVPREHARDAHWVEPTLVGEVEYRTLTSDGRLRHAAWRGLRPDRDAEEIVLTGAVSPVATVPPADVEPDRLATYRQKRDFGVTPEPTGGSPSPHAPIFVVQRHRASRLHYDFRLEIDGALASWAVPRGPTLDPSARHLAVHTEDHPMDYAYFEGVIPKAEYGGGDVIVWDRGTWVPSGADDPGAAVGRGELHFDLYGEKLAGRFVLARRRARAGDFGKDKEQWVLVHKHDDAAVEGWDPEEHPQSVLSARTNDEVAAAPQAMWQSEAPAAHAEVPLVGADAAQQAAATDDELAALDALGAKGTWTVAGRELVLTNLDKVLFPGAAGPPLTKRDLVRYHARIAPYLLPYLVGRPVNLNRFPDGTAKPGFWQKEVPGHAPDWLRRWHDREAEPGDTQNYFVLDSTPALVWMANYGAVELHPWTSRIPDVHQPTWALIDIDPGPAVGFADVLVLARLYRTALAHLHVEAMPKVTGKRGVQIWVPIADGYTFDDTRSWVEKLSRAVGQIRPELVSWEWQTDQRRGLARLDYTQNAINKTLVAPFSPRPAPDAPVSMPITWDELDDPDLAPDRWTIATALDRLGAAGDPLRPLIGRAQALPPL
jgi:bifunctional non-homologous end joining protein LigD